MATRGRKPIAINWEEFEALCAIQATLREMAIVFRCSEDTIQRAVRREYKANFSSVFGERRLRGFVSLRRKIWQSALNGNVTLLIFLAKQYLGMADQVQVRLPGQPLNVNRPDLSRLTDEELELQRYLSAVAQGERLTAEQLALRRRLSAIAAGEPADGTGGGSGEEPPPSPPVRPVN